MLQVTFFIFLSALSPFLSGQTFRRDLVHVFGDPGRVLDAFELGAHEGLALGAVLPPERERPREPSRDLVVGFVHLEHHVPHERVAGAVHRMERLEVGAREDGDHRAEAVGVRPAEVRVVHLEVVVGMLVVLGQGRYDLKDGSSGGEAEKTVKRTTSTHDRGFIIGQDFQQMTLARNSDAVVESVLILS